MSKPKPKLSQRAVNESQLDVDTSVAQLISRKQFKDSDLPLGNVLAPDDSDLPLGNALVLPDLTDIEMQKETPDGIHQKGGKASSSALISADDDKAETDSGGLDKTATTMASGVEIVVAPIKKGFTALQQKIFDTENELERLESKFYTVVSRRAVELEGVNEMGEEEIERHRQLFEMQEITRLEQKMRYLELEKIRLLKQEMIVTARLGYKSKVLGHHLDELEAIMDVEARKRELRITKLYARFNNEIA